MKRKLVLLAGILLITAVFSSSRTPGAPAATTSGSSAPQATTSGSTAKFTILNPRPSKAPIDVVPLANRLSSLDGKTIAVVSNVNEAMPDFARELVKAGKDVKVLWVSGLPVAETRS